MTQTETTPAKRAVYPTRGEPYFANRYCRLLGDSCAAQEIGSTGAYLCVTIAMIEDQKRYTGPVTFHTAPLLSMLGFTKWDQLDRARAKAVEHGWLYYFHPGQGSRVPGVYWVTIPDGLDESIPENGERIDTQNQVTNENRYPKSGEVAGKSRGGSGELSYLDLNLKPKESARNRKAKKTPEDDAGFAAFWAAYPARNGRKLERADAVKEWLSLTDTERTTAMAAVVEYANSDQLPKDAFRWLKKKLFREWTPDAKTISDSGPQYQTIEPLR